MGSRRPRNSTRKQAPRTRSARPKKLPHATRENVAALSALLAERWPAVRVELDHENAYQLLVATILAAQSTDKLINTITPGLFANYPDPAALSQAIPADLEKMIFNTGYYRQKAASLINMATKVVTEHGGVIPNTIEGLCSLPGVGRKTANVVLGNAMGIASGIVVDTHISRVAPRLGLTAQHDPVKIEQELMALVPQDQWIAFGNRMIHHGRYICLARKPLCDQCPLAPLCPSAFADVPPPKPRPKPRAKAKTADTKKAAPKSKSKSAKRTATPKPRTTRKRAHA